MEDSVGLLRKNRVLCEGAIYCFEEDSLDFGFFYAPFYPFSHDDYHILCGEVH